jgi:hypothetical protein
MREEKQEGIASVKQRGLGSDGIEGLLTFQHADCIFHGSRNDAFVAFMGSSAKMRRENDIIQGEEGTVLVDGLMLIHIQTCASDPSFS